MRSPKLEGLDALPSLGARVKVPLKEEIAG